MARQILILGLGQFGMSLARALANQNAEVMVVDQDMRHIQEIAPFVADALHMDATDEDALSSLAPHQRDVCVCAIGDENREASILVTALLRQLGAPRIIARATDALHARILKLVGAHEVVEPERDFGDRLAIRLAWRGVVSHQSLGGGLVITEVAAPEVSWGRTLAELDLPRRFQVTVAAVRSRTDSSATDTIPDAQRPLREGDRLLLVGTTGAVHTFTDAL